MCSPLPQERLAGVGASSAGSRAAGPEVQGQLVDDRLARPRWRRLSSWHAWAGYALWADRRAAAEGSLMALIDQLRGCGCGRCWRATMRIMDIQVVQVLVQSIAFFASSAILIIGGCIAVLGAREQAVAVLSEIPFAVDDPAALWEAKVLLLLVVFVYAFFKFTWALRQFNYVAILIGAAPPLDRGHAARRALAWPSGTGDRRAGRPGISTRRCAATISGSPR